MKNKLFLFKDTDLSVPTESLLLCLTPSRLQKALRYKKESERRICAWSEILLFHALQSAKIAPMDVIWDGKPHFSDSEYHFSLSHTENQIALLITDVPCGIDIEIPHKLKQKDALSAKLFCEKEEMSMQTDEDFFRLWTAKEAFVKYTGEGFSRPFSSFYADFSTCGIYDAVTGEKKAHISPFTAFQHTVGCISANKQITFTPITATVKDIF